MQILRDEYQVLRLSELEPMVQSGVFPERAVVVTFDDGYADNAHTALPVLQQFQVPCTLFVTTDHLDSADELLPFALENLLLETTVLPQVFQAPTTNGIETFDLESDAVWSMEQVEDARRHADVGAAKPATTRHRAYQRILRGLASQPPTRRREALNQLAETLHATVTPRARHRMVSTADVQRLLASGLVELGSHTCSHPTLGHLPADEQDREIQASCVRLRELTGQLARIFAYPFGKPSDYSTETVQILDRAGIRLACTTVRSLVRPGTDRLQLPRCGVRDWDGVFFRNQLERWFHNDF
jgi:peptidoglycan/xylan/chitin deacetylase (PgdA/CDA1 family)